MCIYLTKLIFKKKNNYNNLVIKFNFFIKKTIFNFFILKSHLISFIIIIIIVFFIIILAITISISFS